MKKAIGQKGEDMAVEYLLQKGYDILTRNFRSRFGEIDIVAKERASLTTVFVEVRTKTSTVFGRAEESITTVKKDRLYKTALYYLSKHPGDNVRFDFIAVNLFEENPIEHFQNIIET